MSDTAKSQKAIAMTRLRRQILECLSKRDRLSHQELAQELRCFRPDNLNHTLKALVGARMIDSLGRNRCLYSITAKGRVELLKSLSTFEPDYESAIHRWVARKTIERSAIAS